MSSAPRGAASAAPDLVEVLKEWGRIGCIGFGGPPTHIALLRELCVERRRWLDEREFEDAIAACNLLPGPASTQLSIYCAWRVRGRAGALVGGAAFIVPGLVLVLALSALFLAGFASAVGERGRRGGGSRRGRRRRPGGRELGPVELAAVERESAPLAALHGRGRRRRRSPSRGVHGCEPPRPLILHTAEGYLPSYVIYPPGVYYVRDQDR